jgi:hypothetical protein
MIAHPAKSAGCLHVLLEVCRRLASTALQALLTKASTLVWVTYTTTLLRLQCITRILRAGRCLHPSIVGLAVTAKTAPTHCW